MPVVTQHHRDRETGEVKINGTVGAARAWLEWFAPIIRTVTATLVAGLFIMVAGALWGHERDHILLEERMQAVQEFMDRGDRVFSSTGQPISTEELEAHIIDRVTSMPSPGQETWNTAIEKRLDRIEDKLDRALGKGGL